MRADMGQGNRMYDARVWAAEELALEVGWLRECPYHGVTYRAPNVLESAPATIGRRDSSADLLRDAERLAAARGSTCDICEIETSVD